MARKPERVRAFYDELLPTLEARVRGELDALAERLDADGHDGPITAWDWRYYDEALRSDGVRRRPEPHQRVLPARTGHGWHVRHHRRGARARLPGRGECPSMARRPCGSTRSATGLRAPRSPTSTPISTRARASSATPRRSRMVVGHRAADGDVGHSREHHRRQLHAALGAIGLLCSSTPRCRPSSTSSATSCT